jgi:uncharacterized membrane protein YuzA (DUF378 family)
MIKISTQLALWLVIIGALNWGLVGLFSWNLVASIFGDMSFLSRVIYVLVGISGIWLIVDMFRSKETKETTK